MREVTRPMRGEVVVRAECLLPEKLLERALCEGARFDAIRRDGKNGLVVECDADSAAILMDLCARFRLASKVLARRGVSALAAWARRRRTLPVGLAALFALCWLFLGRIWFIDVALTGEHAAQGSVDALRSAVEARGVRPGMARSIDPEALSESLMAGAGDYSFVGVSLRGVRLLVEAAPETPSPALYDVDAARDLVADRDGIVLKAVAQSGALCVQPGDAVRRGQLLIRGEESARDDQTQPVAALGEVTVRAWYTGEARLPLKRTQTTFTGRSSAASRLITPWFSFDIDAGEVYAGQRESAEYLPIGGLLLPVGIERVTRREAVTQEVDEDAAALRARLAPLAFADAALKLARDGPTEYEIRNTWIDYEASCGCLCARAVYEISANAAVTREALNENTQMR